MDVIGHHAPLQQSVTLTIEVQQGMLDERGNLWIAQITGAGARIFVFVEATAQIRHAFIVGLDVCADCEFVAPLLDQGGRNAVVQSEGDAPDTVWLIEMRMVAA